VWLKGNTTGGKRIRAGMPAGWTVAVKTGTGSYGNANDIPTAAPLRHPSACAVPHRENKPARAASNCFFMASPLDIVDEVTQPACTKTAGSPRHTKGRGAAGSTKPVAGITIYGGLG